MVFQIDNDGTLLSTIELFPPIDFDYNFYFGVNFISAATPSNLDNFLIGIEHETIESWHSQYLKLDKQGEPIEAFGTDGSMFLPIPPDFQTTHLICELSSENLVFMHSDHDWWFQEDQPWREIKGLFVMNPQGSQHPDFGTDGYLDLGDLPASFVPKVSKSQDKDHIYIISSAGRSSTTFHITKLNLEDLPSTPITTSTENNVRESASISLYPNPSSTTTHLLYSGSSLNDALLQVQDPFGQIIIEKKVTLRNGSSIEINTDVLSNGLYLISLSDSRHIINTQKLVVSH